MPNTPPINLYKNNTDNKGASYGTHENYLMRRETPFADIVRHLTPFFVSRQVVTGSGRVGIGQDGRGDGFQISQRADFFEVEVGLETTLKRPIINTRDEPHAVAEKYRRLHVIIGDANLAEVSTYLKLGTTALVLAMIEDQFLSVDLTVDRPVATLHAVSHDPTLRELVTLRSGRTLTAVQLQMEYAEQARKYVEDRFGSDADPVTADVLDRWESVLGRLETDPMSLSRELDWVAKLQILEGYRHRDGLDWGSPRLEAVDLQYSDVRPDKGLYNRLAATGRFDRIVTDAEIDRAVTEPPEDTRAYFRGRCLAKYPDEVAAASWDSVIFDLPGHDSLQRVPTLEPLRGTKEHVGGPAGPLRHRRPAGRGAHRRLSAVRQDEIWDVDAARRYDTPGTGMFAPEVLGPTHRPARRPRWRRPGAGARDRHRSGGRSAGRSRACPSPASSSRARWSTSSGPRSTRRPSRSCWATWPPPWPRATSASSTSSSTRSRNLLTQAEQVACFRNAARHLVPGGRFVIELWVAELRQLPPRTVPGHKRRPRRVRLHRSLDTLRRPAAARRLAPLPVRRSCQGGPTLSRSPHRYIWPAELDLMAQLAGFELEARHADWDGSEFTAELPVPRVGRTAAPA